MTTTFTPPSLDEIRRAGLAALRRELGLVGMIRFLQQCRTPSGDFTAEREELVGNPSVDEICASIEKQRTEAERRRES